MTVDSELRKIWRKDIAELHLAISTLTGKVARLELEISTTHPSTPAIGLPTNDGEGHIVTGFPPPQDPA